MPKKKQAQTVEQSLMTQITLLRPKSDTSDEDLAVLFKDVHS